ncbi:unnamed protein product, partial [Discosporangium mesarthrocarpum]
DYVPGTGAFAISRVLQGNSVLKQLNLTGNSIGDKGAADLMEAMVGLSKSFLAEFWLSRNKIGPKGAKSIGECLANSSNLRHLNL